MMTSRMTMTDHTVNPLPEGSILYTAGVYVVRVGKSDYDPFATKTKDPRTTYQVVNISTGYVEDEHNILYFAKRKALVYNTLLEEFDKQDGTIDLNDPTITLQ